MKNEKNKSKSDTKLEDVKSKVKDPELNKVIKDKQKGIYKPFNK